MDKHKKAKEDAANFSAEEAMNLIDKSYNSNDYNIIPKQENAYLMPWTMKGGIDMIDSSKFYDDKDIE
ncbi:MAG: hypothetical protein N4A68_08730 [Maledivibacter sp.]|jgi:hypothetical protein|nr:hypothetical protein [Maledivibacter sp.]